MTKFIERKGISYVSLVCSDNKWLFREQPVSDQGIDAYIEYVDNNDASKLLALQIKSGESYFKEDEKGNVYLRVEKRHYNYWSKFPLPVIVLMYNPKTKEILFSEFKDDNIVNTSKAYKLYFDKSKSFLRFLNNEAKSITKLPETVYNYNYMLTQLPLIEAIKYGKEVVLKSEEWVNKSSRRGKIEIKIKYGNQKEVFQWNYWFPFTKYSDVFKKLFPWAKFKINNEFLQDEDIYLSNGTIVSYDEYIRNHKGKHDVVGIIRANEVAFYNLKLKINDFGENFYKLNNKLNNISVYKGISITKKQ